MSLEETYQIEREKWDSMALKKSKEALRLAPNDNFEKYVRRASTMVGVSEFLGNLEGKHVLEIGCGLGEISALLARSGAIVTTFDLSESSVFTARRRAQLNQVADRIRLAVAAGEHLPFAADTFDIVFGKAILHHLNPNIAWHDPYRVLKPGGKAAFVEPMGMNPLLRFARNHVPYPQKNPRGADKPLNYDEIRQWGRPYSQFWYKEIQLFGMIERGLGFSRPLPFLRQLDNFLLPRLAFLRRHCRYVVMYMVK